MGSSSAVKSDTSEIRLQKALSGLGISSRRKAEEWIKRGYVFVNGKPAKLGQKIVPGKDKLTLRGKNIPTAPAVVKPSKRIVLAVHKPRGIVTTMSDPQGRPTVQTLVPKSPRLFPVGRLDLNSEGLLLMTNDGELAFRLTHPKFKVPKVYEVKVRGNVDESKIQALKKGVRTDGVKFQGVDILDVRDATREGIQKSVIQMRIYEGQNQEIRRMFLALKCHVIRLKRISMGDVELKGVPRGKFRALSEAQVSRLVHSLGISF